MAPTIPDTPEWQKMLAGGGYNAYDPALIKGRYDAKRACRKYNDTLGDPNNLGPAGIIEERGRLLENILGTCDPKAIEIEPPFYVDYGCNMHVGSGFYANHGLVALDCAEIRAGDRVLCGPYVQLATAGHPTNVQERRDGVEFAKTITIGDDVWLGGNVIVLPGVTIGSGVTVAASSVVNRDVPSNCVVAGTPCRIVRKLEGFIEPTKAEQEAGEAMKNLQGKGLSRRLRRARDP
ncbi:Putative acetyltransferase C18B11.09c [Taphrina deformans PYCC 5710]|uniref:Acetyltransferase C18B11.09c n=1 Tax=Taphrina deformans (strain PYCC 5710 / ATCC 11124 / CBS 356.35 / IMI 108563 / JCM 9778 / NBRC 8474) TaxID=1097556 RepID=R5A7Z1_TAPDE|nr:Putative acetyltransferase C18B11.09c [Taphrina deformans PYCC 5710]|eukprot:CCX35409.1 Putative acetyltransferase C18B11.09c [Taphrina deformans PYCC 5710]